MDIIRIGIAGLGTVGAETFRILQRNKSLLRTRCGKTPEVVAVSARDRARDRGIDTSSCSWYEDARELAAADDLDMVVETIGGEEGIAREVCETALRGGKHLVTANKALIAAHGITLAQLAEETGKALAFEAAVAGGIPILKTLREGLAANHISRIAGILNGTSNFILTRMEQDGSGFAATLKEAQKLGYAEADPTFDIDGTDAAQKLTIMGMMAFGIAIDGKQVTVEGITDITAHDIQLAAEMDCVIRLLGIAENSSDELRLRVNPCLLPQSSALNVEGVINAVMVEGDAIGRLVLQGPGAGAAATASSVVADIMDIARGNHSPPFSLPVSAFKSQAITTSGDNTGRFFIRFATTDSKKAITSATAILDEQGIRVASCVESGDKRHLALSTCEVERKVMERAGTSIAALEYVSGAPQIMAMENI